MNGRQVSSSEKERVNGRDWVTTAATATRLTRATGDIDQASCSLDAYGLAGRSEIHDRHIRRSTNVNVIRSYGVLLRFLF